MIREVVAKDFNQIYELGELLHDNFKEIYNLQDLINKDYYHLLVYDVNDKILGFLMYTYLIDTIDIADIIVVPEHRCEKIGSLLLDYMITNSKIGDKIYLEVNVNNQNAIRFYKKFGFKTIHTRKQYYGKDDALIMERVNENE